LVVRGRAIHVSAFPVDSVPDRGVH
jgi:hypothetical protein